MIKEVLFPLKNCFGRKEEKSGFNVTSEKKLHNLKKIGYCTKILLINYHTKSNITEMIKRERI